MKTIDLKNALKDMKVNDIVITSKGFKFKRTKIGYRDLTTNLNWYLKPEKEKYTYDQSVKKFNTKEKRLPSVKEYKEAENHGFREVLDFMKYNTFWSSSLYKHDKKYARVFDGNY